MNIFNSLGARPGVTIRVQNKVKLLDKPLIYVLDTPGVLNPFYKDIEGGMKLALCNLILESATQPLYVADFLLYFMNKDFSYVDLLELPNGPTNDVQQLLAHVCKKNNYIRKVYMGRDYEDRYDFENGITKFIEIYRSNLIYDTFLDRDKL